MSNSLDPDQARHFVGPDLGPNCLHRLSADDFSRQRVNTHLFIFRQQSWPWIGVGVSTLAGVSTTVPLSEEEASVPTLI